MKSKEYLNAIADKREKMKLKTKLEIYGADEMNPDELKKLSNWGMFRFDAKMKKSHNEGY